MYWRNKRNLSLWRSIFANWYTAWPSKAKRGVLQFTSWFSCQVTVRRRRRNTESSCSRSTSRSFYHVCRMVATISRFIGMDRADCTAQAEYGCRTGMLPRYSGLLYVYWKKPTNHFQAKMNFLINCGQSGNARNNLLKSDCIHWNLRCLSFSSRPMKFIFLANGDNQNRRSVFEYRAVVLLASARLQDFHSSN